VNKKMSTKLPWGIFDIFLCAGSPESTLLGVTMSGGNFVEGGLTGTTIDEGARSNGFLISSPSSFTSI